MLDMIVLAFWTDTTRLSTFMFANDVSGRNFSFFDGVRESHHETSHHANQQVKIDQYKTIVRWHVLQFVYLCKKLRVIQEGERNLLDNSMIMCGSSFSDGNRHDPNNLPILLGGKGGGRLQTGQHLQNGRNTPLCNLYVSMLDCMGIDVPALWRQHGAAAGIDGVSCPDQRISDCRGVSRLPQMPRRLAGVPGDWLSLTLQASPSHCLLL